MDAQKRRFDSSITSFYKNEEFKGIPPVTIADGDFTPFAIEARVREEYGIKTREELYQTGNQIGTKAEVARTTLHTLLEDYELSKKQNQQINRFQRLERLIVDFQLFVHRSNRPSLSWLASPRGTITAGTLIFVILSCMFIYNNGNSNPKNQSENRRANDQVRVVNQRTQH